LFDLNILLDVLQKRDPFYAASTHLMALAETGKIDGYVAAHSLTTLFYLVQKNRGAAEARATINNLLQIIKVAPIDQGAI
jgi:predicted nucleic acid-binding protein